MQQEHISFLTPKIEFILARKPIEGIEMPIQDSHYLYLVKYYEKSYYKCEWLSEDELYERGYPLDSTKKKGMLSRIAKTQKLRLDPDKYFNPNYLIPDRILTSTDLFAAIQPKKVIIL